MRQCEKCRKQIPIKDLERHLENCQRVHVHTSQNAQAPKVIEFQTLESGTQMSSRTTAKNLAGNRKSRVTSAKPPLRVNGKNEDSRPIKVQQVPKWK